ncbi:MAG: hypothetical protein ACE5K0_02520 [Candidatus Methanofastidiosia archaeon]
MVSKHAFSIILKSEKYLKSISVGEDYGPRVVLEGELGDLVEISLVNDVLIEIRGENGMLSIDLSKDELDRFLKEKKEDVS